MKLTFLLAMLLSLFHLSGCQTLGQLSCTHNQIAKYDQEQNKWRCAADETSETGGATEGVLWLNHHDMVVADSMSVTLGNNGTTLWVKPKTGGTFPKKQMLGIHTPTIPPGHYITGLRVCYGIVGNHADTEIEHLRLAQYQVGGSTTGNWPGYRISLEDTSVGSQAPNPPPGGFAYNDAAGFACVNSGSSTWRPCLDPNNGTISARMEFKFGDADDYIGVMAVGLDYDKLCTPN